MNRRGGAHLITVIVTSVVGGAWAVMAFIPEPEGFWPKTWAGWLTIIGGAGSLWLIFGPFMKERLRRFLKDAETLLLLKDLIVTILKTDSVGLTIRSIVVAQFPERFAETTKMWQRIDEIDREVTSMRQSFGEVVEPSLQRIEDSTEQLRRELTEAREATALAIKQAVMEARDDFRDHGGRRINPR